MNKKLSHTDYSGKARMVDVGDKPDQIRIARAEGHISVSGETASLIKQNLIKKGDVLSIAEIAGIQAAKQCSNLIPLCHPLLLNKIEVICELLGNRVIAQSMVRCQGKTGVEMEALTAVSTALLTVYDMCKAVDKKMIISEIRLVEKTKTDL